ncbi:PilZ domain-containing protein [Chitinibacteraceae bacterium HSL-7]
MSRRHPQIEQRAAVRVPVACKAKIRTLDFGPSFYGDCLDLSVTGMTLRSNFVPRPDEEFDVFLMPADTGIGPRTPFAARVRVVRSHELERGTLYEIGLTIVRVLG